MAAQALKTECGRPGVTVEPGFAGKSAQDHSRFASRFDGEIGWSTDGDQCREARHRRFLHQFKTGPTTHGTDDVLRRQKFAHGQSTHQFIEGKIGRAHV